MFKIYKTSQHYHADPRRQDPIPTPIIAAAAPATTQSYIPSTLSYPYQPAPQEVVYVAPYTLLPAAPLAVDTQKTAEQIAEMLAPTQQMLRYEQAIDDLKREQERLRDEREPPTTTTDFQRDRYFEEEARRRVRERNGGAELLAIEDSSRDRRRASSVCSHRSPHRSRSRERLQVVIQQPRRSMSSSRPRRAECREYGHQTRDCESGVMVLAVPQETRRKARSIHYVRTRPDVGYIY